MAQRVGNLAFQQETVGKQLMGRHAGQTDVFDRMAERPMPQVVQQGGRDKRLGLFRPDRGHAILMGELLQVEESNTYLVEA